MGKNKRKYAFGFSGKVSEKSKYEIDLPLFSGLFVKM